LILWKNAGWCGAAGLEQVPDHLFAGDELTAAGRVENVMRVSDETRAVVEEMRSARRERRFASPRL
jgi:hypothetical protein